MSYADNRPLLAVIVYLGFIILVSNRIIKDYSKLQNKESIDFNVIILIFLIIFGVYSLVTDTTNVVKFSQITIKKFTNNPGYLQNQLNQINKLKYYTDIIQYEIIN